MPFRGERLREAREKLGMNQQDFGQLLGVGGTQVSRWENDRSEPYAPSLEQMSIHLHVSTDYLLGLTDDPRSLYQNPDLNEEELRIVVTLRREGWFGVLKLLMDRMAAALGKEG